MHLNRRQFLATSAAALAAPALRARAADTSADRYLHIVRRYADAMIDHGRPAGADVPLFGTVLDRKAYTIPDGKVSDLIRARVPQENKSIANPHYDQNLFQVLHALTAITTEPRYAAEADRTMQYFLRTCQEPRFGFYCWGEHVGWDLQSLSLGGFDKTHDGGSGAVHEFWRPWIYWDKSFALAPEQCHRFAQALWLHQIDHTKPDISWSRHAQLLGKTPSRRGYEFPRHGGFYINTWAHDYKHTQDPEMLKAIDAVVEFFLASRDPHTKAIPHCSSIPHWMRTESNVSLAISLTDAAPLVPESLGRKMLAMAADIDDVFLKLHHDPGPGGKGLVLTADVRDLRETAIWLADGKWGFEPQAIEPRHKAYTEGWVSAYIGPVPHSTVIGYCIERHRQVKSDGYRKLILLTADNYLASDPPTKAYVDDAGKKVTPKVDAGTTGRVIGLMTYAYQLTGDEKYLRGAEKFCDFAAAMFWPDDQPLPVPSTPFDARQNFYSASSRCDTLAMNMLETWMLRSKPGVKPTFAWTDL